MEFPKIGGRFLGGSHDKDYNILVSIVTKRNYHVFLLGRGWVNRFYRVDWFLGFMEFRFYWGEYNPIMENQMEATSENEVETADL